MSPTSPPKRLRRCAPDRFRLRLDIAYDGAGFAGWQRQTHHSSVQGAVEAAIAQLFGEKLTVQGASRTDAGVHASCQVAHVDVPTDPQRFRNLRYSIQCLLPESVVIRRVYLAPPTFHSIASAVDKIYRYTILNRTYPSAMRRGQTWWVRRPMEIEQLNACASRIVGKYDFRSFQTSGTKTLTTVRSVTSAVWSRPRSDTLVFEIRGDGFLKHMVRNLVGTMIDLQFDDRPPEDMTMILEACDRRRAGETAPPHGLCLVRVYYPDELDIDCTPL